MSKRITQKLGDLPALQAVAERLNSDADFRAKAVSEEPEERIIMIQGKPPIQLRRRVYIPDPNNSKHRRIKL